MKILITGGAGFIGSLVCEALLKRGNHVICIDNFNDYYDPKIKENNIINFLNNPKFKLYRKDIIDFNKIKEIFEIENPEKVIHIAARAGVRASFENPELYQKVNVKGTENLLKLAKEYKIKNFIFASSSSVYGINKKLPFSEEDETNNQISPYAKTKKEAELLCKKYSDNLNITCLRLFTVYGPRGRPDMAPYKFMKLVLNNEEIEMYGDGTSKRDYTYVSDIVEGILMALDKNLNFEIINLGNSKPIELKNFIKLIEKVTGKKVKINQVENQGGDVPVTYANIFKAKKLLNWYPKVSLEKGLKKTYKYLKNEFTN